MDDKVETFCHKRESELVDWLSQTVKNWDKLDDSNREAWTVECLESLIDTSVCEVRPWYSYSGRPETFYAGEE